MDAIKKAEYKHKHYLKYKEYYNKYSKDWYNNNKEKCLLMAKNWVSNNKEKVAEIKRNYVERNKFRRKISIKLGSINNRCNNPNDPRYNRYGGRGIKNLLNANDLIFLWNRDHADLMKQPSIDRIDNDGNYTIENCRMIERSENKEKQFIDNQITKDEFLDMRNKLRAYLHTNNIKAYNLSIKLGLSGSCIWSWLYSKKLTMKKKNYQLLKDNGII